MQDPEEKHFTLVELNVVEQCLNLFKTGVVQRKRMQSRDALLKKYQEEAQANGTVVPIKLTPEQQEDIAPRIHGLVFNPADGILKKLPVNFKKRLGSMDHIYGLYK